MWQQQTYAAPARQAKRAQILFWDESGFCGDTVHGRTLGLRGQTPIVYRPGQRQSISAASAAGPRGECWLCTYAGGLNGELFVQLLRQLMHRRRKPMRLILDSLPAHKTRAVREYIESTQGKLGLHFLPGYTPELNPDELVWSLSGVPARHEGRCKRERSSQAVSIKIWPAFAMIRSWSDHCSTLHLSPTFVTAE